MDHFSKRTAWALAENRLSQRTAKLKAEDSPILDLTESNPTRAGFNYLRETLLKPLSDGRSLRYEPSPHGLLAARRAIAEYYHQKGIAADPARLFLTASTSEAYSFLFKLLGDAHESVAIAEPSYPLFGYLAGLNDLEPAPYRLDHHERWQINFESLAHFPDKDPKAIVVVNPNNPTGNYVSPTERSRLLGFCSQKKKAVIADEVFFDYCFEDSGIRPVSFAGASEALTFTLSGISKILGLPQMKLSWILVSGPESEAAEASRRLEVIADTHLSVNTPSQQALPVWLEQKDSIHREILARVTGNFHALKEALGSLTSARLLRTEGGWYAVVRLLDVENDENAALELLEKKNVLVHPGYFYDFPEGNYFVISLLPPVNVFKEGVARLASFLI